MNSEFRIQNSELVERRTAQSFRDLIVWQRAHEFVLLAYQYSEKFPRSEIYGLSSQLRRAAISIAANIAEGFKKLEAKLIEVSKLLEAYTRAISNSNGENRRSPKLGILNSGF